MWTRFMDMHSGGGQKEKWAYIFIEAPEEEAKVIFYNRFEHNPERVTCTCCGSDYTIDDNEDLAQLTGFDRNCEYSKDGKGYIEEPRKSEYTTYKHVTLEEYMKDPKVLFIRKEEIKDSERKGHLPRQGFVWLDENGVN